MKKALILLILLSFLIISSCNTTEVKVTPGYSIYKNEKVGFSFEAPNDWEIKETDSDIESLIGKGILMSPKNKDIGVTFFFLYDDSETNPKTLEEYINYSISFDASSSKNFKLISIDDIKIDEKMSKQWEEEFIDYDNSTTKQLSSAFKYKKGYFLILYSANKEFFNEYLPLAKHMISTFSIS